MKEGDGRTFNMDQTSVWVDTVSTSKTWKPQILHPTESQSTFLTSHWYLFVFSQKNEKVSQNCDRKSVIIEWTSCAVILHFANPKQEAIRHQIWIAQKNRNNSWKKRNWKPVNIFPDGSSCWVSYSQNGWDNKLTMRHQMRGLRTLKLQDYCGLTLSQLIRMRYFTN